MSNYNNGEQLLARDIANTCDTTLPEPEFLRTPADLADYLRRWDVPLAHAPDERDLADILALRERLRTVFASKDVHIAAEILNELLDGVQVRPHVALTPDARLALHLDVDQTLPVARRLGAEAALGLRAAIERYGIERLHMCEATACSDVFIDTSRNHTRRYCCEQCANRHNVAAFRRRQKAGAE